MALTLEGYIAIPSHGPNEFDHGDVHLASGRVYVAHTSTGTVEILDGETGRHVGSVPGCTGASGVLVAQGSGLVLAAARGAGKVLVLDADDGSLRTEVAVGPKPNGLAWDSRRGRLLVADVHDLTARILDPLSSESVRPVRLPGRPRWCVYDEALDRFLVNIREPAQVATVSAATGEVMECFPISAPGPHGLDIDLQGRRVFVAADVGTVVQVDLRVGRETGTVPIAGQPDVVWFNPEASCLYVAIGDPGVIDVIDTASMTLVQELVTARGAATTAFDRRRQRLYVFLPETARAAVYVERNATSG